MIEIQEESDLELECATNHPSPRQRSGVPGIWQVIDSIYEKYKVIRKNDEFGLD